MDDRISSSKRKMEEDFLDESLSTSNNSLSDRDTEYNPPGKKAKKKVENGRNTKKLTPKQRIARLNKKINSKQLVNAKTETNIQSVSMANESVANSTGKQSPVETASYIESLDIYFVDNDDQLILSETNGTADSRKSCNTSNVLDDKDKINDKPKKTRNFYFDKLHVLKKQNQPYTINQMKHIRHPKWIMCFWISKKVWLLKGYQ